MAAEAVLAALRALDPERILRLQLGWPEAAGNALHVRSGGRRYHLRPIAQQNGWTAFLQQAPTTDPVPAYPIRREIARTLAERKRRALVVHTHPVQPVQVWHWIDPALGWTSQYREHRVLGPGDTEALLKRLRRLLVLPGPGIPPSPAEHRLATAIAGALLQRLRRRRMVGAADLAAVAADAGAGGLAPLQQAIEQSNDPAVLRAAWRALRELAILDPSCGEGERLHGALRLLEMLRDACLERMQVWVGELSGTRVRPRPEKLADFRRIVARSRDARTYPDPRHFLVASILRDNLYGVEADGAALCEAETRLRAELGPCPGDCPPLNLRRGNAALGFSSAAELRHALGNGPDAPAMLQRLAEQAEAISRTYHVLRQVEERHDGDPGATPLPRPAIEERLLKLRHELDVLRAAEYGVPATDPDAVRAWAAEHRPVHLWAEFFEIVNRGGFDLVLADRDSPPAGRVKERSRAFAAGPPPAPIPSTAPPAMPDPMIRIDRGTAAYPEVLEHRLREDAPASLYLRGDAELLHRPLLAFFCSVRVPGSIILRSLDAARELRDRGVATVGGFQSPLERECLGFLLRGTQPLVISPARGIEPMRLPSAWNKALAEQRLLLASRFEGRKRRPTTQMAEARNQLVGALADRVLIAHAAPGSRTYRLARTLLEWGSTVFTWDDPHNEDLVRLGVQAIAGAAECLAANASPDHRGPTPPRTTAM
jgi:hypothetical protein